VSALARPRTIVQVIYRSILSSEMVLHIKKPAIVREIKNLAIGNPTPRQACGLTVGRKLTSTISEMIHLCIS
jgi:hypothetical protein